MEPFKNNISPKLVSCFADHLEKHLTAFDRKQFESAIIGKLNNLELKERSQLIADHLHSALPKNHKTRYRILLDMLHPVEDADMGFATAAKFNIEPVAPFLMYHTVFQFIQFTLTGAALGFIYKEKNGT